MVWWASPSLLGWGEPETAVLKRVWLRVKTPIAAYRQFCFIYYFLWTLCGVLACFLFWCTVLPFSLKEVLEVFADRCCVAQRFPLEELCTG